MAKSKAAVGLLGEFLGKRPLSAGLAQLKEIKPGVAGGHRSGRACLRIHSTKRNAELRETDRDTSKVLMTSSSFWIRPGPKTACPWASHSYESVTSHFCF